MLVQKLSKIVLALFFGFSSIAAVIGTEAANPAATGTTASALSGESAPAAAQGYGRYNWHGRRYGHRRWHRGYWGPYHRWHPGFWVYF